VRSVLERGRDPEIAASATKSPEKLRFGLRTNMNSLAVGGDELDGLEVVDAQAMFAHQMPKTTAER
jgi:hypothetical protein